MTGVQTCALPISFDGQHKDGKAAGHKVRQVSGRDSDKQLNYCNQLVEVSPGITAAILVYSVDKQAEVCDLSTRALEIVAPRLPSEKESDK